MLREKDVKRLTAFLLTTALALSLFAGVAPVNVKATNGETWAIYWYLCGTDLETEGGAATNDLLEMLDVDLPDNVTVVIQTGGTEEWQNNFIDSEANYRLVYDSEDLYIVGEEPVYSMGHSLVLSDFITFCLENYPADHTMLLLWDHGGGSGGGICYDELFDFDGLTLDELGLALFTACGPTDYKFDIIGFDACLMATADVAGRVMNYADYMVASQETEPGIGWSYDKWLGALADDPEMDALDLAVTICDSYYEGCEDYGLEDDATLSVLDLSKMDGFIWALDWFGYEGVLTAQNGNAGAFFADFGRGAKSVDYYGDGEYDVADAMGLAQKNKHLFPNSADEFIRRVDELVVYNVTGSYRSGSNGVSLYYPYQKDTDMYNNYIVASAGNGLPFMYQLLFEGNFNEYVWPSYIEWQKTYAYYATDAGEDFESVEQYIEEADEDELDNSGMWENDDYADFLETLMSFEDEDEMLAYLAELGIEFDDASEYDLEDWAIDIYEDEDGITYACLDIGGDAASLLQRVTFMLAYFGEDDEILILGEDFDIDCDWDEGFFSDNFRGVWGAIDDCIVYMEVMSITDDYILYNVPILLNGVLCDLSVAYNYEKEEYVILSASPVTNSGVPSKEKLLLVPGDEITTLMMVMTDDDSDYYEWETLTVTKSTSFGEIELPDGMYGFMYLMTDYADNTYSSQVAAVLIEDGYIEMMGLDE